MIDILGPAETESGDAPMDESNERVSVMHLHKIVADAVREAISVELSIPPRRIQQGSQERKERMRESKKERLQDKAWERSAFCVSSQERPSGFLAPTDSVDRATSDAYSTKLSMYQTMKTFPCINRRQLTNSSNSITTLGQDQTPSVFAST